MAVVVMTLAHAWSGVEAITLVVVTGSIIVVAFTCGSLTTALVAIVALALTARTLASTDDDALRWPLVAMVAGVFYLGVGWAACGMEAAVRQRDGRGHGKSPR